MVFHQGFHCTLHLSSAGSDTSDADRPSTLCGSLCLLGSLKEEFLYPGHKNLLDHAALACDDQLPTWFYQQAALTTGRECRKKRWLRP